MKILLLYTNKQVEAHDMGMEFQEDKAALPRPIWQRIMYKSESHHVKRLYPLSGPSLLVEMDAVTHPCDLLFLSSSRMDSQGSTHAFPPYSLWLLAKSAGTVEETQPTDGVHELLGPKLCFATN